MHLHKDKAYCYFTCNNLSDFIFWCFFQLRVCCEVVLFASWHRAAVCVYVVIVASLRPVQFYSVTNSGAEEYLHRPGGRWDTVEERGEKSYISSQCTVVKISLCRWTKHLKNSGLFFLYFILLPIISEGPKKERHTVIDGVFQKCKDTNGSALERVDRQKRSLN